MFNKNKNKRLKYERKIIKTMCEEDVYIRLGSDKEFNDMKNVLIENKIISGQFGDEEFSMPYINLYFRMNNIIHNDVSFINSLVRLKSININRSRFIDMADFYKLLDGWRTI